MKNNKDEKAKVLTFLFANANISLFGNTLTIYPKQNGIPLPADKLHSVIPSNKLKVSRVYEKLRLYITTVVRPDYPQHKHLHQDLFGKNNWHTHLEFSKTIDEENFRRIMDVFLAENLITKVEFDLGKRIYTMANAISSSELDKQLTHIYMQDLEATVSKKFKNEQGIQSRCKQIISLLKERMDKKSDQHELQNFIIELNLVLNQPTQENLKQLQDLGNNLVYASLNPTAWTVLGGLLIGLASAIIASGLVMLTAPTVTGTMVGLATSGLLFFAGYSCLPKQKDTMLVSDVSHIALSLGAS